MTYQKVKNMCYKDDSTEVLDTECCRNEKKVQLLVVCVPNPALLTLNVLHETKASTSLSFFSRDVTSSAMFVIEKLTSSVTATRVGEILPSSH